MGRVIAIMRISDAVKSMQFSPIRRFNPIAAKAEEEGTKIYKLNIGQPDIETPQCFMDAIRDCTSSTIAYEQSQGDKLLVDSIIRYFKRDYGVEYTEDQIITTNGGSEALTIAFRAILNENDEVIIPEPYYTNYNSFVKTAGAIANPVKTSPEEGYQYASIGKLESALTTRTKAIVVNNPNNPTGRVLADEEMEYIADFAIEHDLWIVCDEVYREYVFDGKAPQTFASLDRVSDRLIIIDSVSKRFSACGARVGFLASKNQEFMQGVLKMAQMRLSVSTLDQIGAAALFELPNSYFDKIRNIYEARRDAAYDEISKIPGVTCQKPGGAFYMMIDLPVNDAEEFLMFMLTEFRDEGETVMFAPAAGFYATEGLGKSEIRIAYVLKEEDMRRACSLIKKGVAAYNKKRELLNARIWRNQL